MIYVVVYLLIICGGAFYPSIAPQLQAQAPVKHTVYLPILVSRYPWVSPFGVQAIRRFTNSMVLSQTLNLTAGWVRLGPISWRALQPHENDPIRWQLMSAFEQELRVLRQAGLKPEIIIGDSPSWATINTPYPTSCGAIRTDKFGAFARFMQAVVTRYKSPVFNVQHWELGNEVDVDPRLVGPNSGFGCWGDIDDPYYGGRHYGEMLKVVTPVIKAADPVAQVWIGGLLLDSPMTQGAGKGRPELFLQGILEAGAAPYFDVVPYHSYPPYLNKVVDPDNPPDGAWESWGGMASGKARYLQQLMARYSVTKPLFLNETGLMCPEVAPYSAWCTPPSAEFYRIQAIYVIRAFTRSLSVGVQGMIWYTLDGPGWRYTNLLDANNQPTLAYDSYRIFSAQLQNSEYLWPVNYGNGVEAYAFRKAGQILHVVWAKQNQTLAVIIPQSKFLHAVDRRGRTIQPFVRDKDYLLPVSFDPIYITRWP
ncbi:MAG: hypothetical protein ACJ8CR_38730 [Roseiflexaceae bacterium]